jgi:hypothetical protein
MHSISVWWSHMVVFSQIFWGISLFGTIVLAMQVASMFLGLENIGGHDTDTSSDSTEGHDTGSDSEHAHQGFMAGLKLFTLRNMVAFVCMFGWSGLVFIEYGASKTWTCIGSFLIGCFSMLVMAVFMKFMYSMQTSGNIDEASFVGKQATVYIAIPQCGHGIGKINFNIGGRLEERTALSAGEALPPGTLVKTISYNNNNFTVERV